MRKALLTILVLAIVVIAVAFLGQRLTTRPAKGPAPATLGEIASPGGQEITARGIVVPVRWTKLCFPMGGVLEELSVATGDSVVAGQVIARLERRELELEVQLAQSELQAQEANLAQLQEGASATELAAAQANYEAAVAAYEKLKSGPSVEEIALAEADLKRAEIALQRAQGAYDAVRNLPDVGARPESIQLELATIDYQRAKAAYELAVARPDEVALKQAQSQVASAKAQLEALRTGARPSEIQAAQAGVARAKANLSSAQLALEQAVLRAPFDGTVTSVDVEPGDLVSAGQVVVTLADLSQWQVETTDLDEWGVANVRLNQTVDLVVPALGRSPRGRLTFIAPEPTITSNGAVFYKAIITLDNQDADLRWGMTVRIKFGILKLKGLPGGV